MSARATEQAKNDLIGAIVAWGETRPDDTESCVAACGEVLAKVAGLIEAAKAIEPSAELAEVRANIARTAAVVHALEMATYPTPDGSRYSLDKPIAIEADAQRGRLLTLLARERELMTVQP